MKKIGDAQLIDAFGKVLEDLKIFAMPVFRSLARGEKLTQQWKAGKGWVSSCSLRICPGTKSFGPWKNSGNR